MTEKISSADYRAAARKHSKGSSQYKSFVAFMRDILALGGEIRLEHRFHEERRWRADIANLTDKVIVEIDGGGWTHGRHHRAEGRRKDNERDAAAQTMGWCVLRVDWTEVADGTAITRYREMVEALRHEKV